MADFEELYIEIQGFYFYWAAYIQKQHKIDDDKLKHIVDAFMQFGREYELFCEAVDSGRSLEEVFKESEKRTSIISGKVFGSDLINVKFDNIYRNIQKGIIKIKPQYGDRWKEIQTSAS